MYEYWKHGAAAGPLVIELAPCSKLGKSDDGKMVCEAPLVDPPKVGDSVTMLLRFFVPKGGKYDDVRVQVLCDGEVRSTSDLSLSESFSYGTYKTLHVDKRGTWEVRVKRGDVVLASKSVIAP